LLAWKIRGNRRAQVQLASRVKALHIPLAAAAAGLRPLLRERLSSSPPPPAPSPPPVPNIHLPSGRAVLLITGAGAGSSAEAAVALPPGLSLAAAPSGKLDVRLQLLNVRALWHAPGAVARQLPASCGGGVSVQLLPASRRAAGFATRAGALALLHALLPGTAGPLLARLAAPVLAADAARLVAGAIPARARAAAARRLHGAAADGGGPASAEPAVQRRRHLLAAGGGALGAALHALRALAGPAAGLAAACFLWGLLHPESLDVARASIALFAVSCEYNKVSRQISRGALPRGPAAEAAWRRLHKRAARRLAPVIGDLPRVPPLAPLLALAERTSLLAGAAASGAAPAAGAPAGCCVAGGFVRGDCWWLGGGNGGDSGMRGATGGGWGSVPGTQLVVAASIAHAAAAGPGTVAPLTEEQLRELFCGPATASDSSLGSSEVGGAGLEGAAAAEAQRLPPLALPAPTQQPLPSAASTPAAAAARDGAASGSGGAPGPATAAVVVVLTPQGADAASCGNGSVDAILEITGGSAGTSKASSVVGDGAAWAAGGGALASHPVSLPGAPGSDAGSSGGNAAGGCAGEAAGAGVCSGGGGPAALASLSGGIIAARSALAPSCGTTVSGASSWTWAEWCGRWRRGAGAVGAAVVPLRGGPAGLASLVQPGPDCSQSADPIAFLQHLPLYGQADHASAAAAAAAAAIASNAAAAAPALPPRRALGAAAAWLPRFAAGVPDAAALAARALQLGFLFAPFLWVGLPLLATAHLVAWRGDTLAAAQSAAAPAAADAPASWAAAACARAAAAVADLLVALVPAGGAPSAVAAYDAAAAGLRRRAWGLLLASCSAAGPSFIKWAQWASSRRDLFADEFIEVVGSLQDCAPKHGAAHSARAVARAFGAPVGELFEEFGAEAVASGSIAQVRAWSRALARVGVGPRIVELSGWAHVHGLPPHLPLPPRPRHRAASAPSPAPRRNPQVHRATLRLPGGRLLPVAVKVRHPGVAECISRDFRLLSLLAAAAGRVRALRGLSLRQSVAQFTATMTAQCDLRVEAVHALRFANNFAGGRGRARARALVRVGAGRARGTP
jgi:hypothetical protein